MASLQDLHESALKYYEEKNLDKALEIYNQIIMACPSDEVALSCVQDIYLELGDRFNYYLSRANVNIAQGKYEYAINDTKKAIALDIDNIDAKRKLARLYKVSKQNLKSVDEFLRIIQMNPDELDAYFELVDLYMLEDSLDSAINIARQGVEHFSDNENLKNLLAQLYFKNNDYESALSVVADNMLRAKILLQKGDDDKAKEILDSYDENSLNDIQKRSYYILIAQYCYNKKELDKALEYCEKYSNFVGPDAISFQMKALIYEEKGDSVNSYINWGFCNKVRNRIDEAIVEFNNAYQENPKEKTALIELAKLYAVVKEKYVSMEFWQKVYDLDKDEEAREILSEFYYSEGDFKKAEEYGKVIEKAENNEPCEEYTGLLDKIINFFQKNKR